MVKEIQKREQRKRNTWAKKTTLNQKILEVQYPTNSCRGKKGAEKMERKSLEK